MPTVGEKGVGADGEATTVTISDFMFGIVGFGSSPLCAHEHVAFGTYDEVELSDYDTDITHEPLYSNRQLDSLGLRVLQAAVNTLGV